MTVSANAGVDGNQQADGISQVYTEHHVPYIYIGYHRTIMKWTKYDLVGNHCRLIVGGILICYRCASYVGKWDKNTCEIQITKYAIQ